jgi:hypothetical protein
MAAGTVAITEETIGQVKKIAFSWISGTDGEAGTAAGTTLKTYNGVIERLVTIPGVAPNVPTDLYDITIDDEDKTDVLMGAGKDRSNANIEQVGRADLGVVANDKLTLKVADAGVAKKGTVYLYIR